MMLTGRYEPTPTLGQLTAPTTGESMVSSFKADYMQPFLLTPGMEKDKREQLSNRVGALNLQSEAPLNDQGFAQKSLNWLSGMAGSILNPYSLITGEVAGMVAKPLVSKGAGLIGRYLPSAATDALTTPISKYAGNQLPEFVGKESAATLTGKAVSGYAQATGFSLPTEIANTYNPKTDQFDWQHGIKASFEDGGVGLALMATPYAAGILWGKIFGKAANHAEMPMAGESKPTFNESHIDDAVKQGRLTDQEGQWFKDYLTRNDTNENLSARATEMLIKDGHPVNSATNQVMFKILHPDDVNNFQTAVADGIAAKLPDNVKDLYSKFIGHNSMDNLRENPSVIDGLKGVVNFVRKRLEKAPEEFVKFQKIMKRLLPENIKEENPLTQNKIYQGEKRANRTGMTIPIQVKKRLKQDIKIKKINQKIKSYENLYAETGRSKYKKLADKHKKLLSKTYYTGGRKPHVGKLAFLNKGISLFDPHVGQGYWYAESEAHAEWYGKHIEKIEGEYNIYDLEKGKDSEINKAYKELLENYEKVKKLPNTHPLVEEQYKRVEDFRNLIKSKGYEGMERLEGFNDKSGARTHISGNRTPKKEIMFFEKPTSREIKFKGKSRSQLLNHKEEIQYIRDTLLPEGKVAENFKAKREYQRLLDLTKVRNDARRLMHEIHIKHEYELHDAYATMLDTITKVMRSEFGRLAKPEDINDYMRERIQNRTPELKNIELANVKKEVKETQEKLEKASKEVSTPEGRDVAVKGMDEEIKESEAKENKAEYDDIKSQMDEFKDNKNVFSNFIKCIVGSRNG